MIPSWLPVDSPISFLYARFSYLCICHHIVCICIINTYTYTCTYTHMHYLQFQVIHIIVQTTRDHPQEIPEVPQRLDDVLPVDCAENYIGRKNISSLMPWDEEATINGDRLGEQWDIEIPYLPQLDFIKPVVWEIVSNPFFRVRFYTFRIYVLGDFPWHGISWMTIPHESCLDQGTHEYTVSQSQRHV